MNVQEERRHIVAHIESYELQIRLIEGQLADLRRMNPRARGVASLIAHDERTLAGHRAGLAERRARLAELDETRRRRCPWCGDHFRYPGYPDGLEVYCSPGCKRAAWHDDADGTAGRDRGAEKGTPTER